MSFQVGNMRMRVQGEDWPYIEPFRITGFVRDSIQVVVVTLQKEGRLGRGEAAGVRYRGETAASIAAQIEAVRPEVEAGVGREALQRLLPPGGARNALDCALWELEARLTGNPVWKLAGVKEPRPLLTVFTCGADGPQEMAARATAYTQARALKLKLTGEATDAERVRRVRQARPDVWLGVDANQGFTLDSLKELLPVLLDNDVNLIEQPLPIGQEALLAGFDSPIPLAADESAQCLADVAALVGRFSMVNIKLDKCGGLTEGLAMARAARQLGLEVMVGNMGNTSLAMAPAFVLGQLCEVVDLDGPAFLKRDREIAVEYADGLIACPEQLWGQ